LQSGCCREDKFRDVATFWWSCSSGGKGGSHEAAALADDWVRRDRSFDWGRGR
jgi:hypothetical protein